MTNANDYDCFLSHNSKDKGAARALAERLRAARLSTWMDQDRLPPGQPWQPRLEAGIRASRSIAVLIGGHGLGPWQDQEVQCALQLAVRDQRPVIPVLLPGAPDAPDLPLGLAIRTWVDLRPDTGLGEGEAMKRLIEAIAEPDADGGPSAPAPGPATAQAARIIDVRTWDHQRLGLRDLLVALPPWALVRDRKAFVDAALGTHPAGAGLGWEDDGYTVATNLVKMLQHYNAQPLADGHHAVCGLLAEVRARGLDLNPTIATRLRSLADAFGCEVP